MTTCTHTCGWKSCTCVYCETSIIRTLNIQTLCLGPCLYAYVDKLPQLFKPSIIQTSRLDYTCNNLPYYTAKFTYCRIMYMTTILPIHRLGSLSACPITILWSCIPAFMLAGPAAPVIRAVELNVPLVEPSLSRIWPKILRKLIKGY